MFCNLGSRAVLAIGALGALVSAPLARAQSAPANLDADLRSIVRAVDAGRPIDPRVVDSFWRTARERGLPLVNPIDGDSLHVRATFFYRDTIGVSRVSLVGGVAGHIEPLQQLEHVRGTDVWFKTVIVRADARITYQFRVDDSLRPMFADSARAARLASGFGDAFNPQRPAGDSTRSIFLGPLAPSQPWIEYRSDVPHGALTEAHVRSARLHASRLIYVYTPPGYDATRRVPLPLLVMFDGDDYVSRAGIPTPTILDNLIAARRIPPVLAVFISNPPSSRMAELTPNDAFADFVADEVVPWIASRFPISGAERRIVGGSSLGGLMASYLALHRPEVFGNVVAQSASYWWSPVEDPEAEWLARRLVDLPPVNVRFHIEVGVFEIDRTRGNGPGQVVPNRHFRDILRARGFRVTYHEFAGGHEPLSWRGTLGDAIEQLLAK